MSDKIVNIRKAIARLHKATASQPSLPTVAVDGPQGPQGPQGLKGDGFRWRGKSRTGVVYRSLDVVHHEGAAWVCTAMTQDLPPSSAWAQMCKAVDGAPGEQGERGLQGERGEKGVQGPQGEPGAESLRWMGSYSPTQTYEVGDIVGYEGGAYICVERTSQSPITGAGWQVLAEAGKQIGRASCRERV